MGETELTYEGQSSGIGLSAGGDDVGTRTGLERGGEGPDSAEDEGGEDGRDTHDRLVYSRQTRGDCLGKQPGGDLWRFYTPQGSEKKGKMKREGHFLVAAEASGRWPSSYVNRASGPDNGLSKVSRANLERSATTSEIHFR